MRLFFSKGPCILFFIFCVCPIFSQTVNLVPKEVYVGDEAEIRFAFDWNGNLFADDNTNLIHTVTESAIDESLDNNYTIKEMQLAPTQTGYELIIVFIPWKAGTLNLEAFDVATIFDVNVTSLLIDIPQVQIQSILSQTDDNDIKPPSGPIIIPGTTYVLVAIVILIFILCLLIIIVLARLTVIKKWLQAFFGKIWASSNFKKASKELLLLSTKANTIEASVFAAKLSIIIRTYMEGRFSHRFTAETTSSFFVIFNDLFAGTVSVRANEALQDLYEICVRCDFLHYSGSEAEKAPLVQGEIDSLIERTKNAILYFEKKSDDGEEYAGVSQ